jgi:DNA-binding MarR family transcriptional regulator
MSSRLAQEIKKRGPFDSLEQEVLLNLLRTADALAAQLEPLLRQAGVSATQYNALRILRGAGEEGLPCGEVSQRMITREPDITRLLDRLERRGLISRCRGVADRRVVRAKITRQGLDVLAQLDAPLQAAHREQFAHMDRQKLQTLLQLLEEARTRFPSPGTPGEGTGEGSSADHEQRTSAQAPHPNPLPGYGARGPDTQKGKQP